MLTLSVCLNKGGEYMNFRHEYKHEISYIDRLTISSRLSAIAKKDEHSLGDGYNIRSLYFDNIKDKALLEKIDGVNIREKFRLRYYNGDKSFIVLEKKGKINGLCTKSSVRLSERETQMLLEGDFTWIKEKDNELLYEFYSKATSQNLKPKTIVDYTRQAFVFPAGNVRVTLDYNIRSGIKCVDFLNPNCVTVPIAPDTTILEVKWDEFLPDIIRDAVQLKGTHTAAFSKYATCRIYG